MHLVRETCYWWIKYNGQIIYDDYYNEAIFNWGYNKKIIWCPNSSTFTGFASISEEWICQSSDSKINLIAANTLLKTMYYCIEVELYFVIKNEDIIFQNTIY